MGSGRTRSIAAVAALVAALGGGAAAAPAPSDPPDKTDNVRRIAHFDPARGGEGGDIAFAGNRVYAADYDGGGRGGGIHVLGVGRRAPVEIAHFACPGDQNDVAAVGRRLIAVGYHNSACGGARRGVRLIDVSNPRRPRFLGSVRTPWGTHTLTTYPGKPLIYASPGGAGSVEQIVDVSNPRNPRVVATFDPEPAGCHDLTFHFEKGSKLAYCAGATETQIWDVSSPRKPEILSRIDNPAIRFHHSVAVTSDGELAVIGDESTWSNCEGAPTGAVFAYDVSDPRAPLERGWFAIPRGRSSDPYELVGSYGCTAHNFGFRPGTRLLAAAWYRGGMNVIDWSDPMQPEEVAHYRTERTNYWSAYWHRGRIYANGRKGLDVFTVRGL